MCLLTAFSRYNYHLQYIVTKNLISIFPNGNLMKSRCVFNLVPVLPCDRKPCKNGGKCTNDGQTCFKCACLPGFKGSDCSKKGKYDTKCSKFPYICLADCHVTFGRNAQILLRIAEGMHPLPPSLKSQKTRL
jgi:hypothetical protein